MLFKEMALEKYPLLSIESYLNNLESEVYLNYSNQLDKYYSYKELIIIEKNKKDTNSHNYYSETASKYQVLYENDMLTIIKPVYINLWAAFKTLTAERKELETEYDLESRKYLFSNTNSNHSKANEILKRLMKIENAIIVYYEYYLTVNKFETKYTDTLNKLRSIQEHKSSLYEKILNEPDKSARINLIEIYLQSCINKTADIEDCSDFLRFRNKKNNEIDFIVYELPKFIVGNEIETKKIVDKAKQEIVEHKIAKIEKEIKEKIATNFKFSTLAECISSKRTASYYMSKEDLVKAISSDKELLKIMPSGFKKLKKEHICKMLEKYNYIS